MPDFILEALRFLFSPMGLLLGLLGVSLGIFVGAIPGLTGAMLIALTLPLTYSMESGEALILLVGMYVGSVSGGLVTATLLNIPGTPASIVTTLDGYPMAQAGQPGRALALGIGASLVGGVISFVFLALLAKPAADLSTRLSPFDFFSLVCVALVLISSVSRGSILAGIFAGFLGIFLAMPGTSPVTGQLRLTFGFPALNDGFKLLPVLIGLFAFSQILQDVRSKTGRKGAGSSPLSDPIRVGFSGWRPHGRNLLMSSTIGTWIGILPGIGANIGSLVAYGTARGMSKKPEKFGHGSEEGIVASEAANNATVGGALIPLIALGIPGSVIDAILLGAFEIHGLTPGPLLFENEPVTVAVIVGGFLMANALMFFVMRLSARWLLRVTAVPLYLLAPAVIVSCVTGSYALANRMTDVWVMLAFGLLGLVMNRFKIPLAPFVIGFVLGPIAEENLGAGLMLSGGSFWPLLKSPFSLTCLCVAAVLLCWPWISRRKTERRPS